GKFIWQAVHDPRARGLMVDWPRMGVCSTPAVDGDRVYYVASNGRVVCADVNGLANGNQGFQGEKYKDPTDADILWEFDLVKELGVVIHADPSSSPVVVGNRVFVVTGNGVNEDHSNVPAPQAPSFIALDKMTGKLLWKDNSPGKNILHGQWSSPAYTDD